MTPLSILQDIVRISRAIYDRVQLAEGNKETLTILSRTLQIAVSALQDLETLPNTTRCIGALTDFKDCAEETHQVVKRIAGISMLTRMANAKKNQTEIDGCEQRIKGCVSIVNMAISAQIKDDIERYHLEEQKERNKDRRDEALNKRNFVLRQEQLLHKTQRAAEITRDELGEIMQKQFLSFEHRLEEQLAPAKRSEAAGAQDSDDKHFSIKAEEGQKAVRRPLVPEETFGKAERSRYFEDIEREELPGMDALGIGCDAKYTGHYSGTLILTIPNMASTPVSMTMLLSEVSGGVSGTIMSSQYAGTFHGTLRGQKMNTALILNSLSSSSTLGGKYPIVGIGGISPYGTTLTFSGAGILSLPNSHTISGTLTGPVSYGSYSSGMVGTLTINASHPSPIADARSGPKAPNMAFGKKKWAQYFGDIGAEPPLPRDIDMILNRPCPFFQGQKIKESHQLVLIPKTIDGRPLTLASFGSLVGTPKQGNPIMYKNFNEAVFNQYGDLSVDQSHWVLITKEQIPKSINNRKMGEESLKSAFRRTEINYELPSVLDATISILVEYVSIGESALSDKSRLHRRCKEKIAVEWQREKEEAEVMVGDFSSEEGLDINITIEISDFGKSTTSPGIVACHTF